MIGVLKLFGIMKKFFEGVYEYIKKGVLNVVIMYVGYVDLVYD